MICRTEYQKKTAREIPVVILHPQEQGESGLR